MLNPSFYAVRDDLTILKNTSKVVLHKDVFEGEKVVIKGGISMCKSLRGIWMFVLMMGIVLVSSFINLRPSYAREYAFSPIKLKVNIPDDEYYVVVREGDELHYSNIPAGIVKDKELLNIMKDNHIYLDAIAKDFNSEITFIDYKEAAGTEDLKLGQDWKIMSSYKGMFSKLAKDNGGSMSSIASYPTKDTLYYVANYTFVNQRKMYIQRYGTLKNGHSINVTMFRYDGPVKDRDKKINREIIDGLIIPTAKTERKEVKPAKANNDSTAKPGNSTGDKSIYLIIAGIMVIGLIGLCSNKRQK